jgi:cephalosporin-C deacetylase-like acetyl esterase
MATVAYDEDKLKPVTEDPKDFDSFWTGAIAEARKTPLDATAKLLPDRCTSDRNVYEVSFQNERRGSRMYGILCVPAKEGRYPAVLQVPGAGVRPYSGANYGEGVITLEIGIHGIPVTLPQVVYNNLASGALSNYWTYNINDRDASYYKRVYLGCIRAVDFIFSLPEFDGKNVGVAGSSQGGALSIVTAALDPRIRFLAPTHPALCDHAGFLKKRAGGWPHYFYRNQPKPGELEALAYYDVVNFARRLKVPGLYTWGFNDDVCPPTSMHAAYNVITAPKMFKPFLDTGHWFYPEENRLIFEWIRTQCGK